MIFIRALYGLKSSVAMWCSHFADTLHDQGFHSSLADPDVWLHLSVKPDGFEYYEYLLIYVGDLLEISHCAKDIIQTLETKYGYHLKDIGLPKC